MLRCQDMIALCASQVVPSGARHQSPQARLSVRQHNLSETVSVDMPLHLPLAPHTQSDLMLAIVHNFIPNNVLFSTLDLYHRVDQTNGCECDL